MAEHQRAMALDDDDVALVCDVGGGTTDFSLIRVRIEAGAPAFERMAIGDHSARRRQSRSGARSGRRTEDARGRPAARLAITQRAALRWLCSAAKEQMLGRRRLILPITLLGSGRSLVGDSMTVALTRDEVEAALHEFLPLTEPHEGGRGRDRRVGLRELGLPYETDPAITRHLTGFLARSAAVFPPDHRAVVTIAGRQMIRPDVVLFNGGFFTPASARDRVAQALAHWFGGAPRLLAAANLEAAVAVGAATYARLREGVGRAGALVKAGSGRAYYIALRAPLDEASIGVCVLRGTEEGTEQTPTTRYAGDEPPDRLHSTARRRARTALVRSSPSLLVSRQEHAPWSPYSDTVASPATSSCRSACRSRSPK